MGVGVVATRSPNWMRQLNDNSTERAAPWQRLEVQKLPSLEKLFSESKELQCAERQCSVHTSIVLTGWRVDSRHRHFHTIIFARHVVLTRSCALSPFTSKLSGPCLGGSIVFCLTVSQLVHRASRGELPLRIGSVSSWVRQSLAGKRYAVTLGPWN